jgi:biopolymer transport protein ExbD
MMFRRRVAEEPKVDMTPMVDVVFLLLIFFMISTTFVETPGISVDLPQSSSEAISSEPVEIKAYVDKSGAIHIGERQIALDDLEKTLAALVAEKGKQATFVLMADRDVRHGLVVRLMDAAQEAGFTKLAIGTEKLPNK